MCTVIVFIVLKAVDHERKCPIRMTWNDPQTLPTEILSEKWQATKTAAFPVNYNCFHKGQQFT